MLSGTSLCDELITRPEESHRLGCVVVCDLETSWMSRPWPTGGLSRQKTNINSSNGYKIYSQKENFRNYGLYKPVKSSRSLLKRSEVSPYRYQYIILLALILLTWRIWWAPNNASRWQMGFNSAFKGLMNVIVNNEKKKLVPLCTVRIGTTKWYCHLDRSLAFNVFGELRTLCWPQNVKWFTV